MIKVTAVITTYKRPYELVKRAVDSVLAQTYESIEIILVDDNREDGVQYTNAVNKIVQDIVSEDRLGTKSIRIIPTEGGKHGGQAARNTGIHNSTGELIAFLDDDDEWLPEKIRMQVALMEERRDAGMCYCRGNKINENLDPPYVTEYHGSDFAKENNYQRMLQNDYVGTTTQAMIRKSTFDVVGEFDEKLPARQDYEMWIRISRQFPIVGVDELLFNYYIAKTKGQVSKNWDNCIAGHTRLYNKYKDDIDKDSKALFNVRFYLAHYYMMRDGKVKSIPYYMKAFATNPLCFWNKGLVKLRDMKSNKGR